MAQHIDFQVRSTTYYKTKHAFDNIYLDFFTKAPYKSLRNCYIVSIGFFLIKLILQARACVLDNDKPLIKTSVCRTRYHYPQHERRYLSDMNISRAETDEGSGR